MFAMVIGTNGLKIAVIIDTVEVLRKILSLCAVGSFHPKPCRMPSFVFL